MSTLELTIPLMGKRKIGRPPKRPIEPGQSRSSAYVIAVRLDPALGAAFDRWVGSMEVEPTMTAAVETALREFLRAKGFYPDSAKDKRNAQDAQE